MTDLEYKKNVGCVVCLCRCAVNETTPQTDQINELNLDHLFKTAQKHMLASMIGLVLKNMGISTTQFKDAIASAQRQAVILNNDLKIISSALEAAGIWYMPLKGAVLKDVYPRFAMREMCDYDVLFDALYTKEVRKIMIDLGFQVKSYGESNDDVRIEEGAYSGLQRTILRGKTDEMRSRRTPA